MIDCRSALSGQHRDLQVDKVPSQTDKRTSHVDKGPPRPTWCPFTQKEGPSSPRLSVPPEFGGGAQARVRPWDCALIMTSAIGPIYQMSQNKCNSVLSETGSVYLGLLLETFGSISNVQLASPRAIWSGAAEAAWPLDITDH